MWEILDTGTASAERNMAIDAELLEKAADGSAPILHLYRWARPSATYGYFVNPADHLDLEAAARDGLELARRPTGGGIVFHLWDLAFSVIVPASAPFFSENTLSNYAFINRAVANAVEVYIGQDNNTALIPDDAPAFDPACSRFCMAQPTKYDVVLHGRKIAGAAQRQKKNGFLHQGTISLKAPSMDQLESWLLRGSRVLEAMQSYTFALLPVETDEAALETARSSIQELLYQSLLDQTHSYAT